MQAIVSDAVASLIESGKLPSGDYPAIEIVDTKQPEHGDYACNFALTASKVAGKNPRELGEMLAEALRGNLDSSSPSLSPEGEGAGGEVFTPLAPSAGRGAGGEGQSEPFAAVEVAGPGFVNLRLNPAWIASFLPEILDKGDNLSQVPKSPGSQVPKRINLEFVSVNPNGPITIGSGRGAAYGSTLGNVLEAAGNTVHREYYINDGVNSEQMRLFAESVRAIILGTPTPENGYKGDYVIGCAAAVKLNLTKDEVLNRLELYESGKAVYAGNYDQIGLQQRMVAIYKRLKSSLESEIDLIGTINSLSAEEVQRLCEWRMITSQGLDLGAFGVTYDTWFSEQSLHDSGVVDACIQHLIENGTADEEPYRTKLKLAKGGKIEEVIRELQVSDDESDSHGEDPLTPNPDDSAPNPQVPNSPSSSATLWLRSTKFGDDMDRVLRRKDGRLTYIASDVAYHKDKFNRPENADKLITILGPDHHGYIGRLQAVLAAQLLDRADQPDRTDRTDQTQLYSSPEEEAACQAALAQAKDKLHVQIYQLVRFLKDGKPAPMRKRDGNIFALIDLIDEIGKKVKPTESVEEQRKVGKDVARFFYLMRSHDTTFDFDLDLAEKQSDENPVFYVQYAHARICSILKKAQESLGETTMETAGEAPVPVLTHEKELELIKKICDLPYEVERCAADYGVHRLTTYAIELARTFHHFYDACRVIQDDQPELTRARLALCQATKHALKSTFNLLGIEAPERMER